MKRRFVSMNIKVNYFKCLGVKFYCVSLLVKWKVSDINWICVLK